VHLLVINNQVHCVGKITIKHVTQTQLSLINGTLHSYMFQFSRNHHQTIHTKHVKHLNWCVVRVSQFESIVRLPSDCSLWQLLLLVHKFLSWLIRRRFIKFLNCLAWWPNFKGRQKVTASTSWNNCIKPRNTSGCLVTEIRSGYLTDASLMRQLMS
jgi:hypothetical protein